MCLAGATAWSSALSPEPLPSTAATYRYGANLGGDEADMFSVPIATVLPAGAGAGFSLALSPEDPVLELTLAVGASGLRFGRELLRLGSGRPMRFSAHVIAHAACWRPALQFATAQWPSFFEPWVEHASEFEGLGSYSWNQAPYNASRARAVGFKTNWDLSGTWMPYDGLFLPYMEEWPNLGPINGGLKQYNVTYKMMEAYYEQIQAAGFHSLSYFDIGNCKIVVPSRQLALLSVSLNCQKSLQGARRRTSSTTGRSATAERARTAKAGRAPGRTAPTHTCGTSSRARCSSTAGASGAGSSRARSTTGSGRRTWTRSSPASRT